MSRSISTYDGEEEEEEEDDEDEEDGAPPPSLPCDSSDPCHRDDEKLWRRAGQGT